VSPVSLALGKPAYDIAVADESASSYDIVELKTLLPNALKARLNSPTSWSRPARSAMLRLYLESARIKRRELFDAHGGWGRFNVHTLRHSFVTRSLALGVPEDTVRQHTGHRSGELQRYREFAKSAADLAVSELTPLDEAIPEFVKLGHRLGQTEKRAPEIQKINVRNPSVLN
jgi:integrase